MIGSNNTRCKSVVTQTDRGAIGWPSALNGAVVHASCPHGSLGKSKYAERACMNGVWGVLKMKECLFHDPVTRKLQLQYVVRHSTCFVG